MDFNDFDPNFIKYLTLWWFNLKDIIQESISAGRKPVLIALSRKMPRFIEWFYNKFAPNFPETFKQTIILEKADLTSEIAIPFICLNEDTNNYDFIILDDLIIHGNTLTVTSELLFQLTGMIPRMSCIAMLNSLTIRPNVEVKDLLHTPVLSQKEIDKFAERISEIVELYQLPVDMEFPIFTLTDNEGFFNNLLSEIGSTEPEIENPVSVFYERGYLIGKGKDKISIDLKISESAGDDTDFSKIRFYKKSDGKIVFEVFSPMILSESVLTSEFVSPFSEVQYLGISLNLFEKLWKESTSEIRKYYTLIGLEENSSELPLTVIKRELARSLAVWANYLFSFSTYIRNQCDLFSYINLLSVELSKTDLTFLIGKEMTDKVYNLLKGCMRDGIYVISNRLKPLDVPIYIFPDHLKRIFKSNKIIALIESDSVEEVCERIFKYMHYTNPEIAEVDSNRRLIHNKVPIGETFKSLSNAMIPFFMESSHLRQLHVWVDQHIDAGRIIPKYNRVEDSDGNIFWRRYFHAGIRKFQEFLQP